MLQLQPVLEDWKKNNFELIIITSDTQKGMQKFVEENNIEATVLLDPEYSVGRQYGVQYIPTDYLVDEKGKIVDKFAGWNSETSLDTIEKWIKG